MNPAIAFFILRAAELLVNPDVRTGVKDINDAIALFVKEANTSELMKKSDGTDWTVEDVLEAQAKLNATNQEIRDAAKGDA